MTRPLLELLREYRRELVNLDATVDELYDRGWFGEIDHNRFAKFIHEERFRIDRAIKAGIATPPPPEKP